MIRFLLAFFVFLLAEEAFAETVAFEWASVKHHSRNLLEGSDGKPYQEQGRVFSVTLNQTIPLPIRATAESRSDGVGAEQNADYSIYLDILYTDGTPEWGVVVPFTAKTTWEFRSLEFAPSKPIRSLSMYLMFRNRAGRVEFRHPTLTAVEGKQGEEFFTLDGYPVRRRVAMHYAEMRYYLRDVAKEGDWLCMEPNGAGWQADGITFDGRTVRNTTGGERCVTLICALALPEPMTKAFLELGLEQNIQKGEYGFFTSTPVGMRKLSRLPLLGVGNKDGEHWIGIFPDRPAVFRLFYNGVLNELCVAYDLGFVEGRDAWELGFFTWKQTSGGMRAAWEAYRQKFPEAFALHLPKEEATGTYPQGNWMAFASIRQLPNYADFGFRFKEGVDETAWDDEHGILSYRYTEPMTWWMALKKETIRPEETPLDAGVRRAEELAQGGTSQALAWQTSVMHDAYGHPVGQVLDTPWCNGIVWSMNSMPNIPGVSDFQTKWNADVRTQCYEKPNSSQQDGEYIDSSEGYVTAVMDFRRENMSHVKTPLAFDL